MHLKMETIFPIWAECFIRPQCPQTGLLPTFSCMEKRFFPSAGERWLGELSHKVLHKKISWWLFWSDLVCMKDANFPTNTRYTCKSTTSELVIVHLGLKTTSSCSTAADQSTHTKVVGAAPETSLGPTSNNLQVLTSSHFLLATNDSLEVNNRSPHLCDRGLSYCRVIICSLDPATCLNCHFMISNSYTIYKVDIASESEESSKYRNRYSF